MLPATVALAQQEMDDLPASVSLFHDGKRLEATYNGKSVGVGTIVEMMEGIKKPIRQPLVVLADGSVPADDLDAFVRLATTKWSHVSVHSRGEADEIRQLWPSLEAISTKHLEAILERQRIQLKQQTARSLHADVENERWRARYPEGDPTISSGYLRQVEEFEGMDE